MDSSERTTNRTAYTGPSPEEIAAAASGRGGWTKAQLAKWGVPWPPPTGWRRKLVSQWKEAHPDAIRPTSALARKIATHPPHVQAGITAYRAALNRREDWHDAVAAAIDVACKALVGEAVTALDIGPTVRRLDAVPPDPWQAAARRALPILGTLDVGEPDHD